MPISQGNENKKKKKKLNKAAKALLTAPVVAPMVALSGFVPMPLLVQSARAGSMTLNATGSFITGFALSKKADLKFGKLLATDTSGKISVSTAGAHAGSAKAKGFGAPAQGKYDYTAATTGAAFDITVSGLGTVTPVTGTAKLTKILFGKAFHATKAAVVCTAVGTVCKETVAAADFTKTTVANAPIGGVITWGAGALPVGTFTNTLTVTMGF